MKNRVHVSSIFHDVIILFMPTKYILHGGNAQDKNTENDKFFTEILSNYKNKANILLVQFAAIPEKQEIYKQRHISQFEDVKNGRILNYQVANIDNFMDQVKWADVLYFCGSSGGGATERLINIIKKFSNLIKFLNNKTIVGESAGANCLTKVCYSKSAGILYGLGLVNAKSIMHYQLGDEKILKNINPELDTIYLESYKYSVI